MKHKFIKHLAVLACLFVLSAPVVLAVTLTNPVGEGLTFEKIVNNVITTTLGISGVLALIAFIYGGITWMTSQGNSAKVEKGKNMMIWAVAGLLIIFAAYSIITLIFTAFYGGGGSDTIGDIGGLDPNRLRAIENALQQSQQ